MKISPKRRTGYMLLEAMAYLAMLFALLGVAFIAFYRCVDSSLALRRNADDITTVLRAGERWRADVRAAEVRFLSSDTGGATVRLVTPRAQIDYCFESNAICRRIGTNSWSCLVTNVKWSAMELDRRKEVTACRWDLQLIPYWKDTSNPNRVRPLFSFVAVPGKIDQ